MCIRDSTKAFDDIRQEVEARVHPSRKTVSLAVGPIFGARWLVPRLAQFRKDLPHIDLVLRDSPRITDAVMMTTHLAVDWGHGEWSGLESHRLLNITYSPVISPSLLANRGGLDGPRDLTQYPIIHQRDHTEWRAWFAQAGCADLPLSEETTITDTNTVMHAAIEGQGVSLGIFPFVQAELDAGRLVKPFDVDLKPKRSFYLLAKSSSQRTPEVAGVMRWLLGQVD